LFFFFFFEISIGQVKNDQVTEDFDYSLGGSYNITEPFPTINSISPDKYDLCLAKGGVGLDYFVTIKINFNFQYNYICSCVFTENGLCNRFVIFLQVKFQLITVFFFYFTDLHHIYAG
jgi:hypothetical protein